MLEFSGRNLVLSLTVGGAVAGTMYLLYRWRKQVKDIDEGFSDERDPGNPMPKRVLVLGLDGAGKSCLLSALSSKTGFTGKTEPTEGFSIVNITNGIGKRLDIWEIGGAEKVRRYWPNFIQDTDILVYVIDASDRKRFPECYTEMHKLLGDQRLDERPFLVVSNKKDKATAASIAEIKEALGLEDIKHHRVQIVEISLSPQLLEGVDQVKEILLNTI